MLQTLAAVHNIHIGSVLGRKVESLSVYIIGTPWPMNQQNGVAQSRFVFSPNNFCWKKKRVICLTLCNIWWNILLMSAPSISYNYRKLQNKFWSEFHVIDTDNRWIITRYRFIFESFIELLKCVRVKTSLLLFHEIIPFLSFHVGLDERANTLWNT